MLNGIFRKKAAFWDDEIELVLSGRDVRDAECGIDGGFTFYIYPRGTRDYAGYVSLRLGESPELYYLGHIGYRVEEQYRGNGYAARACELLKPLMKRLNFESVCITANPENTASRKTCEKIGCILESTVKVPSRYVYICSGAEKKCRYILYTADRAEDEK